MRSNTNENYPYSYRYTSTSRRFDLVIPSAGEHKTSHADRNWEEIAAPSGNKRTFPRPMTVYQRPQPTQAPAVRLQSRGKSATVFPGPYIPVYAQNNGGDLNRLGQQEEVSNKQESSLFKSLFGIYSNAPENKEMLGDTQEQSITYPTGWKWFLILLSGALPYIVVSAPSMVNRGKGVLLMRLPFRHRWFLMTPLLVCV